MDRVENPWLGSEDMDEPTPEGDVVVWAELGGCDVDVRCSLEGGRLVSATVDGVPIPVTDDLEERAIDRWTDLREWGES